MAFYAEERLTILRGDALALDLPDDSVDLVVTSPPYFGLRSYQDGGDGARAIFLDPPYATSGDLYAHGSTDISAQVREWCATADPDLRIVLCGYDDEHDALGWERIDGKAGGGAGYSTRADNGRREGLWLSPACLGAHRQEALL